MERKKFTSALLTFVMTLGGLIGYRVFSSPTSNFNARADKIVYSRTLDISQGPGVGQPKQGMLENAISTCYYSTNSDLNDTTFLVLSATDAKTPGIFMNLTVINGLMSVRVVFSGGPLSAIATPTIFEDYTPEASDALTSGVTKTFSGLDQGYLLIMTDSLTGVSITEIKIEYYCSNEVDNYFVYEPGVNYHTGSRSWAQNAYLEHSSIRFDTNPTIDTNNYSSGTSGDHNNYWYRFNGVTPRNYTLVGETKDYSLTPKGTFTSNSFEVIIGVMVDPSSFYNPTKYYCVAPWVALGTADHGTFPDAGNANVWMQSYIGNDNFDPIGGVNLLGRTDAYTGRFFTNFAAGGGGYGWGFQNPDTTTVIGDPTTTLREAYEAINLPFFNIRFVVNLNSYGVYINGFKVYEESEAFYLAENYINQTYTLESFELQAVNYGDGIDTDGEGPDTIATPLPGYFVAYTNPFIRELPL